MAKEWKVKGLRPKKSFGSNAAAVLPVRVDEVYSWAPYVQDPDNASALHDMRISIKRLRYSMELFGCCYGPPYQELLDALADWQQHLGDIHDCDVIEQTLSEYIAGIEDEPGSEHEARGVRTLREIYRRRRSAAYAAFLEGWGHAQERDFRGRMLAMIHGTAESPTE